MHDLAGAQPARPTAQPPRVAVDEKQVELDGEEQWLYAAIDTESKLLLEINVYSGRGVVWSPGSVPTSAHRETRRCRTRVPGRRWRLSDCPLST